MPRAQPGQRFGGRAAGTPNKVTSDIKAAILQAASLVGYDGKGTDGLQGYLQKCAEEDPRTFMGLLGRIIPHVVEGSKDAPLKHEVVVRFIDGSAGDDALVISHDDTFSITHDDDVLPRLEKV